MDDAFVAQIFGSLAEIIAHVALRADPIEVPAEPFGEIDLRRITGGPNRVRPTDEMSHLAGPKFAINFRRDSYSERIGNAPRNLAHGHAFAAADVHCHAIERIGGGGQ